MKEALERVKLSPTEFAAALGVTPQTVINRNRDGWSRAGAFLAAALLGVDVEDLEVKSES
jgi:DNA-binding XRE family transcriptional regulator